MASSRGSEIIDKRERNFLILGLVGVLVFLAALASVQLGRGLVAWDPPVADVLSRMPGWYGAGMDFLGSIVVVAPVVTIGVAYLAWKRLWWGAAKLALPPLVAEGAVLVIKNLIARARPLNVHEIGFSFPSGHATNAAVLACLAAWFALSPVRARRPVIVLVVLGALWALAMSAARVAWGVHYFTDVLGGLGLGAAIGGFTLVGVTYWERRSSR